MKMTIGQLWDYLIEQKLATEEELLPVTCINGYNSESLNDVLYARTGWRDTDQLDEESED